MFLTPKFNRVILTMADEPIYLVYKFEGDLFLVDFETGDIDFEDTGMGIGVNIPIAAEVELFVGWDDEKKDVVIEEEPTAWRQFLDGMMTPQSSWSM